MKHARLLFRVLPILGGLIAFATAAFSAQQWTQSTNALNLVWWAVASSADGTKLVAAVYNGGIYTSTNSGLTWVSNNVPARIWFSVASSADGTRLVAVINTTASNGSGGIYTSADGGVTWTLSSAPANLQAWSSVASSADGTKLVAAGAHFSSHQVYTSTDMGASWAPTTAPDSWWSRITHAVASSADRFRNWRRWRGTPTLRLPPWTLAQNWTADGPFRATAGMRWPPPLTGTKLVAAAQGSGTTGQLYTSTNSGAMWNSNNVDSRLSVLRSVASSSDGSRLVAGSVGHILYFCRFRGRLGFQTVCPHTSGRRLRLHRMAVNWSLSLEPARSTLPSPLRRT